MARFFICFKKYAIPFVAFDSPFDWYSFDFSSIRK